MLCGLLSHEKGEITPYINGTLFSIIGVAEIREEALAMDMEKILNRSQKDDPSDISRQIKLIIKQLNSKEKSDDVGLYRLFHFYQHTETSTLSCLPAIYLLEFIPL